MRVAAEAAGADETFEAVGAGLGVALLAAGNAELYRRDGVVTRPVDGLGRNALAVVWRAEDARPSVRDLVDACARARPSGDQAHVPTTARGYDRRYWN